MTLEIWRPRSAKVRFTAWVTLATLLTGPAGLASAAPPVAPATTKATGPAAAPPPPAKPADKLATDTPWALPTRLPAARITVLSGAVDAAAVALAFDERAGTGLSAGDRSIKFRTPGNQSHRTRVTIPRAGDQRVRAQTSVPAKK